MYYVSRYRGAPSYCQDTEGIIEQRIITGYMNLRLIKSLVKRRSLMCVNAGYNTLRILNRKYYKE